MRKLYVLVLWFNLFFSSTIGQEKIAVVEVAQDSIEKISLTNFWQLLEHTTQVANPAWNEEKDLTKKKKIASKIKIDVPVNQKNSFLFLDENGNYESSINGSFSEGLWLQNQKLILLEQKIPFTGQRDYQIVTLASDYLILKKGDDEYKFISNKHSSFITATKSKVELVPNQGFSMSSIWKGIVGMLSLLIISFLCSSNRKAIKWKTIGIGLILHLVVLDNIL